MEQVQEEGARTVNLIYEAFKDELTDELGLARLTGELKFFVEYFSFFIAQEYMKVYISASVTHLGLAPFMIFGSGFLSERVRLICQVNL